jgi:DNA-binding NtrC family response regulator
MAERSEINVVIIEDNVQMSEMAGDFLKEKFPGITISSFTTGEEALFKLKQAPTAFILDYNLSTKHPQALNGMQVMMQLKNKFDAPVIILSAQERGDVAENAIKYGAYSYVNKDKDSFNRLQVILGNILKSSEVKKNLSNQKTFTMVLAAVAVLLAVLLIFTWLR